MTLATLITNPILDIRYTAAGALVVFIVLAWYWRTLAGPQTPRSRRRIRRATIMIHVVLTIMLVYALSVVSRDENPGRFLASWISVLCFALMSLGLAGADSVNNIRIGRRERTILRQERREALRQAAELIQPENPAPDSDSNTHVEPSQPEHDTM